MATQSRRLLLVAYHFPPMGGSGVQRPSKFTRYLPQCGWQPVVLCAGHDRYPLHDATLCGDAAAALHVERFAGAEPAGVAARAGRLLDRNSRGASNWEQRLYWLLQRIVTGIGVLPETEWLWAMSASGRARQLVRRFGIDAVMTSGPPFTTHLLGLHLQRRLGLPWIAEFRDPLTTNFNYAPNNPREDRFWRKLEADVIRRADHVVVTCDELAADLRQRHAGLSAGRISTILNGWDPADGWDRVVPRREPRDVCLIRYVGAFYQQRSIEPMLRAMRLWLTREPQWVGRVRFEIVGSLSAQQRRLLEPGDERFLSDRGYAPHEDAAELMRSASALYLTVADAPGGELCLPGKTFEYLASGRPILATVARGTSLESILTRAGGVRLAPHQPEALATALAEFCPAVLTGQWEGQRRGDVLHEHRRDERTRELGRVLDAVVEQRPVLRAVSAGAVDDARAAQEAAA